MAAAAVAAQNLGFDGTVGYSPSLEYIISVRQHDDTTILFHQRGRLIADPTAKDWHVIEVAVYQ